MRINLDPTQRGTNTKDDADGGSDSGKSKVEITSDDNDMSPDPRIERRIVPAPPKAEHGPIEPAGQ